MGDLRYELTSCLVSSTLFPRASLAAVARSPAPTLLSLAISVQAVSWNYPQCQENYVRLLPSFFASAEVPPRLSRPWLTVFLINSNWSVKAPGSCDEVVVTHLMVSIVC